MTTGGSQKIGWLAAAGVLALYLILAAVYTRPLLELHGSHIAGGGGDPVLNASVLWWNATTHPLTERWWNPPYFYLTRGVTTFTENLLGISVIASPIYWLTGNPLTAYNLSVFLTWPLSAFAMFLLVFALTRRMDAAFVAGLAYGFTPYRMSEYAHLQMTSSYWMPIALLGLHQYVARRRVGWLGLFGAAWLLQSLSNGYLMLFGAVLIGLWLLFFCSSPDGRRALPVIGLAWIVASLPLVPILLRYRAVHEFYGLRRSLVEPLGFSADPSTWFRVSHFVWLWSRVFPESGDDHFPGVTAVAIVLVAVFVAIRRWRSNFAAPPAYPRPRAWLAVVTVVSVAAILFTTFNGPWSLSIGEIGLLRVADAGRAEIVAMMCGGVWLFLTLPAHVRTQRSAFAFYVAATLAMGVFAVGPILRLGDTVFVDPAPYRWLMSLPGFDQVRVPMRFWMLGVLCLSVAAGLAIARLPLARRGFRLTVFSVAVVGLLLDGWTTGLPMGPGPMSWPVVEPRQIGPSAQPLIELPLGPVWGAEATYRSISHRRPVVNGVSGYEPAHYTPLQEGLNGHDPAMLLALASFGSFDVVVNGADDPAGAWSRYATSVPGVVQVASDGTRTAYRVPAWDPEEGALGERLPVASVQTSAPTEDAKAMLDGNLQTGWRDLPQRPGQWVLVDLGGVQNVGGVTQALGEFARDFPRVLVIDLSVDGATWEQVWEGPTAALSFRAAVVGPLEAAMRFTFPARPARFVRLRQIGEHRNYWRIFELAVYAPPDPTGVTPPPNL